MRARSTLLLGLLLLPACASDPAGPGPAGILVTATVGSASTERGAEVSFRVENRTSRPVYLARCGERIMAAVDRWQGAGWVAHRSDACQTVVPMVPVPLRPGEARLGAQRVEQPGRFRLRLGAAAGAGETPVWDATSPGFHVSP